MTGYGYVRPAIQNQSLLPQRTALHAADVDTIVDEKVSGAYSSRPKLDALLNLLTEGDTLVIVCLDQLGRLCLT